MATKVSEISEFTRKLKNNPRKVRAWILTVLTQMKAKEALPEIIDVLKYDESSLVRLKAIFALEAIGAEEAIDVLISTALSDSDSMVRRLAVWLLGECGPKAKNAIPSLIKVMENDPDETVRGWAGRSLAEINAKEAIPAMIRCLDDSSPSTRWRVAYALGLMGAKVAKDKIEEKLKSATTPKEKFHMAVALARLSEEADEHDFQKSIKIINEMKKNGELDEWYHRNFEMRFCKEFSLDINKMFKKTQTIKKRIQRQTPSKERKQFLVLIEEQEKHIKEIKNKLEQMGMKDKPHNWFYEHISEIIIGILGFIGTIIAALIGVLL